MLMNCPLMLKISVIIMTPAPFPILTSYTYLLKSNTLLGEGRQWGPPKSLVLAAFTLMISVLSLWMFSRTAACALVFSCVCWWLQDSNDKSSKIIVKKTAKSRSSSCVHWISFLLPSVIFFFNPSITHRIGNGDSRHACLTPVWILNSLGS